MNAASGLTMDDVLAFSRSLERSYAVVVAGRVKVRVGRLVFLAFSKDETLMGFAFPKEERAALVGGDPDRFLFPAGTDMRFNWVVVRLATIGHEEMYELVLDAWGMVVPKKLFAARVGSTLAPPK